MQMLGSARPQLFLCTIWLCWLPGMTATQPVVDLSNGALPSFEELDHRASTAEARLQIASVTEMKALSQCMHIQNQRQMHTILQAVDRFKQQQESQFRDRRKTQMSQMSQQMTKMIVNLVKLARTANIFTGFGMSSHEATEDAQGALAAANAAPTIISQLPHNRMLLSTELTPAPTGVPGVAVGLTNSSQFHMAIKGANQCDFGQMLNSAQQCAAATHFIRKQYAARMPHISPQWLPARQLNSPNMPGGCTVNTGVGSLNTESLSPIWNDERFGVNTGNYSMVCTSFRPTTSPTNAPTAVPTSAPTQPPTGTPSNVPTLSPTKAPTKAPTTSPTNLPTSSPTMTPTDVSINPATIMAAAQRARDAQQRSMLMAHKHVRTMTKLLSIKNKREQRVRDEQTKTLRVVKQKEEHVASRYDHIRKIQALCDSKGSESQTNAIKHALHKYASKLPPIIHATSMHKIAIIHQIQQAIVKLSAWEKLNTAHAAFDEIPNSEDPDKEFKKFIITVKGIESDMKQKA